MEFVGSHILSVEQFDRADIEQIFAVADDMEPYAHRTRITRVLQGAILSNMFFESSTRTRVSFGCAFNLLGGEVRETTEIKSSAIAKGESLHDMARVLSGYSDVIVMRHPTAGSVKEFAEASRVPVINGGDGAGQHPTQTLLDLFTIREELGKLEGLTVGLLGDLRYGRTVHSLAAALARYDTTMHFIAPESLAMPRRVTAELPDGWSAHTTLHEILPELDLLYVTRIQKERFPDPEDYARVAGAYTISAETLRDAKPVLRILHPLPRVNEIATDVDDTDHAAYFRQAFNGVPVRMALLEMLLGSD